MPRGKRADDGHETNRAVRAATPGADGGGSSIPSVPYLQAEPGRVEAAACAFLELMARTDGWLRCIPAGEGKVNYFKWKFSSGEHKGKYVMYVGHGQDWTGSILGLAEKLAEVDAGVRRPALDTFYDPR